MFIAFSDITTFTGQLALVVVIQRKTTTCYNHTFSGNQTCGYIPVSLYCSQPGYYKLQHAVRRQTAGDHNPIAPKVRVTAEAEMALTSMEAAVMHPGAVNLTFLTCCHAALHCWEVHAQSRWRTW